MVNLAAVHPVSGGRWHRVDRLQRLPKPGELLTMMCGVTEEAEFVDKDEQATPQTCWLCDLVYRRQQGVPILPDHPALGGRLS